MLDKDLQYHVAGQVPLGRTNKLHVQFSGKLDLRAEQRNLVVIASVSMAQKRSSEQQ